MSRPLSFALIVVALLTVPVAAQVPGDYPHLVVDDGTGNPVPGPGGPFDNSGVFQASAGAALDLTVTYAAEGQSNDMVAWGLLVSVTPTPFSLTAVPPPLFTMPPFIFVVPTPLTLDVTGTGVAPIVVPEGLYEGTTYVQALVYDVTSMPRLKLSNGVALEVTPPAFNVAFSFARDVPNTGITDIDGVGNIDLDGDTLNTFFPLGNGTPPPPTVEDMGLPAMGMRFLPILPNAPDAPVNPLARPFTTIATAISDDDMIDVFEVEDTSFFPPRGTLYVMEDENPWGNKGSAGTIAPDVEVVTYRGKTPTSFTGIKRTQLGSTGEDAYTHIPGDVVLGSFTFASSAHARARSRVCLDASNDEFPHVVIPPVTFDDGSGPVIQDIDLFLYEDIATNERGFAVLDRLTHTWRPIPGTLVAPIAGRDWDPMVAVSPDRRSFLACVRTKTGEFFDSDPDELWAIRLDGLDWPASGAQTWQVLYEVGDDPVDNSVLAVRSREIYMPSIAILGTDAGDYVGFVGLKYKFAQTQEGDTVVQEGGAQSPLLGFEGFWVREEIIVRDYIEVPLVPPGSSKSIPATPRPYIIDEFGITGTGQPINRFDPAPLVDDTATTMLVTAGNRDDIEDVFSIRTVSVTSAGGVSKQLFNMSGYGFDGGLSTEAGEVRAFNTGGTGNGQKVAFSPSGSQAAWVKGRTGGSTTRDWLNHARTNGTDFAQVANVYEVDGTFRESGPFTSQNVISGVHWLDEDHIAFLMGRNPYNDPANLNNSVPSLDLFVYTLSTDTMVNVSNTGGSGNGFGSLGVIRPAATWMAPDRSFVYVLRGGGISPGNTILSPGTTVMNVLGLETTSGTLRDLTGDEFTNGALIANVDIPFSECRAPVETPATMQFAMGSGSQDGMIYFTAHLPDDPAGTDELYGFNSIDPFVAFQVTSNSPAGATTTNVAPSPYGGRVAFARTAGPNPDSEHPFVVDLDNFLFERDLTPTFQANGTPIGRFMDGSFHYIPPDEANKVGQALVFSFGPFGNIDNGVAEQTSPVYYPLANVSDTLAEPVPLLLPIVSVLGLSPRWKIFIGSAGLSSVGTGE